MSNSSNQNPSDQKSSMLNYERVKSDPTSAELYTKRRPGKHRFEMQMVAEAFEMLPQGKVSTVLDAPCGVGRLSLWLGQHGFQVTAIDLGEAAVQLTRELLAANEISAEVRSQNIFKMEYADAHFDATVCFRLVHHFADPADQAALIAELCRVSAKYVVISYFSPYSFTSLRRKLRLKLKGIPVKQNPNTLDEIKQMFSPHQFQLLGTVKRSAFLHSLQVAVFRKQS